MSKKIYTLIVLFTFCAFLSPFPIFGQSVHILMPVYNSAFCLNSSLDSIFKQNHEDVCLIAFNDGSTDGFEHILYHYRECHPRQMIIFGLRDNKGISFARKALLEKSFEINPDAMILWLDSDDRFTDENFVKTFVNQMARTGADICLFNFDLVLEDKEKI